MLTCLVRFLRTASGSKLRKISWGFVMSRPASTDSARGREHFKQTITKATSEIPQPHSPRANISMIARTQSNPGLPSCTNTFTTTENHQPVVAHGIYHQLHSQQHHFRSRTRIYSFGHSSSTNSINKKHKTNNANTTEKPPQQDTHVQQTGVRICSGPAYACILYQT